MTGTLTFGGRLPGAMCSPALPPAVEAPLRLDVAAFVGFAERGPLDQPVAVEDVNQYRGVFGGDLLLAQDDDRPVYAHLPEAVAAFFENGGRRAYVVRVAGPGARPARLPIPGLRVWSAAWGSDQPVAAEAAWPGHWSDRLSLGTQLLTQPLVVAGAFDRMRMRLPLDPGASRLVQAGDLLRVQTAAGVIDLFLSVADVVAAPALHQGDEGPADVRLHAEVAAAVPFSVPGGSPPGEAGPVLLPEGELASLPEIVPVEALALLRFDLTIREDRDEGPELERWADLRFGAGGVPTEPGARRPRTPGPTNSRRWWADALQPPEGANGPPPPAAGRSSRLRAPVFDDRVVYVPAAMDELGQPGAALGHDDAVLASPPSGWLPGDDGLAAFDPVACHLDANLVGVGTGDLLAQTDALTVLAAEPIRLHGIHSLVGIDEVALIATPDASHRPWRPAPQPPPTPEPPPPERESPDWSSFRNCAFEPPPAPPRPATPQATLAERSVLDAVEDYDPAGLLAVQQSLVEMCAARAEVLAVLSLPAHFTPANTLDWSERLLSSPRMADGSGLSYAAVWHPWPLLREQRTPELAPLRPSPPDGAACGTIAARELQRGVWHAPANVALRGPVGLTPELSSADWPTLFDAHVNLLRHQPAAFSALSAHTLSGDGLLLQVSVRRLLILLRKLALEHGYRYVFEPNTDRFRRQVRGAFERLLSRLAAQGALVDYEVLTGEGLNTPNDVDSGRVVVAIKVAPTSPIEFITVTLVRDREGILDVSEG